MLTLDHTNRSHLLAAMICLLSAGCGSCASASQNPHDRDGVVGTCTPSNIDPNAEDVSVRLPQGCHFEQPVGGEYAAGTLDSPRRLASPNELEQVLRCNPGVSASGLDLEARDLWLVSYEPSGSAITPVSDGHMVTFVSRQFEPCPGEAHGMPGPTQTFGFLLPHGARPQFAHASCTIPAHCD